MQNFRDCRHLPVFTPNLPLAIFGAYRNCHIFRCRFSRHLFWRKSQAGAPLPHICSRCKNLAAPAWLTGKEAWLCEGRGCAQQSTVWGHSLQHPKRAFPSALRSQSLVTKDGPQHTCSLVGWFSFKQRSTNTDGKCWNPQPSSSCKKCTVLPWILPGQPSGSHLPLLPWRGLLPAFGICQSHVVLSSQM